MLIQLLEYLQSGKTYSVQELAELLHKDVGSIQVELEYLENQGYIRKVAYQADAIIIATAVMARSAYPGCP